MKPWYMPGSMKLASIWVVWACLAVGALGWALFIVLEFFDAKGDAAAWVQAIGSVMAVIVAILVANQQHRRDEARRIDAEATKELGLSMRLAGFAHEFFMNVYELLRDQGGSQGSSVHFSLGSSAKATATAYVDKKIASVLERMLTRLNSNFDDDMDSVRRAYINAFRQNLSGLIFLLNETTDSEISQSVRSERIRDYRRAARQLRHGCMRVLEQAAAHKQQTERAL